MLKQIGLAGAALTAMLTVPAAADAQYWGGGPAHYQQIDRRDYDSRRWDRGDRGRGWDDRRGYNRRGDGYYGDRGYRGYRGGRGRCDKGTGGTIIGAIAGGLLGNSVAGRGDRTAGAVVGAGVGALAGRAIDRNC